MTHRIVTLPGDGIGPEIMAAAYETLDELGDFTIDERLFGGASIDAHGEPLTDETLAACQDASAVLLAAVGGSKWNSPDPEQPRPEQGLLALRKGMGLYANLRPVKPEPALYDVSTVKERILAGTDLLVVRELTGGIYFGERGRRGDTTFDTCEYSPEEIERVARVAFQSADVQVTCVEYPEVPLTGLELATAQLWRETVDEIQAREFPHIRLEHLPATEAAARVLAMPRTFDVILIENMLGDILSDEAGMLTGSLGMLPSASLGEPGQPGLFEPVHGSAPDIAGQGIANPLAMFLSEAMMLHELGMDDEANALRTAVSQTLHDGLRTPDLGGDATTGEMTRSVLWYL